MQQESTRSHHWLSAAQYACFSCRKAFRHRMLISHLTKRCAVCPECEGRMWYVGTAFRAPRQDNVRQWRKIEFLVRNGFTTRSTRALRNFNGTMNLVRALRTPHAGLWRITGGRKEKAANISR